MKSHQLMWVAVFLIAGLLGIFMFPQTISRRSSLRELFRQPQIALEYKQPLWSVAFNNVFPKPQATFVLHNREPKDGKIIPEGVLIAEIAEDQGTGTLPAEEEYHFYDVRLFRALRPGKSLQFTFYPPVDRYKPARYRLRITPFLYLADPSPVHKIYESMQANDKQSPGIMSAWKRIYFIGESGRAWKKKLPVLGTLTIESEAGELIEWRDFYTVFAITGITACGALLLVWKCYSGIQRRRKEKIVEVVE